MPNEDRINILCNNLNARYTGNKIEIGVSTSIGIAFYPKDEKTVESVIEKSDLALYMSKESDKNQFTIYSNKLEYNNTIKTIS